MEGLEDRDLLSSTPVTLVNAPPATNAAVVAEVQKIEQQVLQTVVDNFQHSPLPALFQQAEDQYGQLAIEVQQWIDQWMLMWMPPSAQTSGGLIGHDPILNVVEGSGVSGPVVSFSDTDGNTDPSKYTASINWGDGQTTSSNMIGYSNGQFQVYAPHTYAEAGSYPIVVTITDSDGDQTTATATALVSDAPLTSGMPDPISATAGQAYSGNIHSFTDGNASASASDFTVSLNWGDNQTSAGSVSPLGDATFMVAGSHTYSSPGTYTVTSTVTDKGGSQVVLSTTATVAAAPLSWLNGNPSYQWSQTAVADPSILPPAAQINSENDSVSLQVQASDPNHYPLSYDAVNLPPGLSINSSTGLISGTIAYGAAADFDGSYTPTIIVANNQGGSAQASFTWTVNQAQVAPVVTAPGNQSNLTGDSVNLQVTATQVDNDALSYDASNLPDGLSIDPDSGLISGTVAPDAATGLPYAVTVMATDDATNLSASQNLTWSIGTSTAAPTWTAPGNQSNAVGDDVSLQLTASDANQDALTYTANGLPPGLSVDPVSGLISGTLTNSAASSTPYNVTVMASNGISSSSQSFTWTVNAISLQNPGDQSNLDGDSVSLPLSASDASNGTLSYSATGLPSGLSINSSTGLISGALASSADASSPYAVTVTATDGTNTATQSFNWTVAKLALNPVDDLDNQEGTAISLQLSATDNGGTPSYSATGLPPGVSLNSTTGLISGTVGLGAFGSSPYQVTVTATDGSSTSSQSFVWTVTPRVALVNPGPQSNASGDSVSLQVSATSPGGTLTYSASGLPNGVSINSSTGLLSGTLATTDASATPYTVTVTANDGTSSSTQTFQWLVSAINLVSPGDQTNNDGDAVNLSLTTGYHGSGTLSYNADGLPPGLYLNSMTGQITGTVSGTADTNSPYQVTVTATDGTNTSTQTFNWTVNAVVSVDALDDQTNAAGDAVSLPVSASDANNATLSFSATGLPPGLSISSTTGLISGTIATGADTNSPYGVTVTINDGTTSATQTFNWTVTHVALVNPGPQQSLDGAVVSLQLQGGDADGDAVNYTATGLPPGLSINGSTGLISGSLSATADTNSPYNVTVTASDGTHTTTQTFLWTVSQVVLTAPSDQTTNEGDTVSLQLQGLVSGGTLSYSASGLPDGLSINPTTGLISGILAAGAAANGPFTVDVSASNGAVSTSQAFTWSVNPVVTLTAPADQSNSEGDSVSLPMSATDARSNPLTYSADGLPAGLSINSSTGLISGTISAGDAVNGPYVVTVTASDGTYSSSVTFTWNVAHTDTTALTMSNPGTQTNVAGDSVNLPLSASDPDGIDTLTYSATGLPDGLDIDPFTGIISGTVADDAANTTPYQVTVTAEDGNGQTLSQTFTWLVNAPALTAQVAPITAVEGNDTGSMTVATFTTADMNSQASDFAATLNWGDGSTDTAAVSGSNGSFTVTNEHTFDEKGSFPVSVTITDTVTGASTTVSTTATVADAALTLTGGLQLGAVVGQSSNLTLATLVDGNPIAGEDYTATSNWGDGSTDTPATLTYGADGVVSIAGAHTYSQKGTYTVTVTVNDVDGATATATSTVVVGDVYAGIQSNLTVATFQDSNTSVPASQFTATIQWGDGTQSSGTVSGGNGTFTVQGTHTYAVDSIDQPNGVYAVTVTIQDQSANTLTSSGSVAVMRIPVQGMGSEVAGMEGQNLNNVVLAEFTDPDLTDAASVFTADVNWGDSSAPDSNVQVVGGNGLFQVVGSHVYNESGQFPITVQLFKGDPAYIAVFTCKGWVWAPLLGGNSISGPTVVPGDSRYTYTVPLLGGVLQGNPQWFVETLGGQQTPAAVLTGTARSSLLVPGTGYPQSTDLSATVQFANTPGVYKVGVKYTMHGETHFVWSQPIVVVAVTISKPAGDLAFRTRYSFALSEEWSRTGGYLNGTQNPRFPLFIVDSPELVWNAEVKLTAPEGYGNDVSKIQVGFVQHASWLQYYGYYGRNTYMVSELQPTSNRSATWYRDVAVETPVGFRLLFPYYNAANDAVFNVVKNSEGVPMDKGNEKEIASFDGPRVPLPTDYKLEGILLRNWQVLQYLQYVSYQAQFNLDIVASTAQGGSSATNEYWVESRAPWLFSAPGIITVNLNTPQPTPRNFNFVPLPFLSGIFAPKAWPANPSSPLQEVTNDKNSPTANQLLKHFAFQTSNKPFRSGS